jgi:hypothetical protein
MFEGNGSRCAFVIAAQALRAIGPLPHTFTRCIVPNVPPAATVKVIVVAPCKLEGGSPLWDCRDLRAADPLIQWIDDLFIDEFQLIFIADTIQYSGPPPHLRFSAGGTWEPCPLLPVLSAHPGEQDTRDEIRTRLRVLVTSISTLTAQDQPTKHHDSNGLLHKFHSRSRDTEYRPKTFHNDTGRLLRQLLVLIYSSCLLPPKPPPLYLKPCA